MWFNALMKKIEVKSLVSGDKAGRLLLEFNVYNDRIIDDLNKMMKADEEVKITIEEAVRINNGI